MDDIDILRAKARQIYDSVYLQGKRRLTNIWIDLCMQKIFIYLFKTNCYNKMIFFQPSRSENKNASPINRRFFVETF